MGRVLPEIPDIIPKWRHAAHVCNGHFAKFVLLWASLLLYSPEAEEKEAPGITFVELACSFEMSMGVPLPERTGSRDEARHAARSLEWRPFDRSFGVDAVWGEKAAVLRCACSQLAKLLGIPLLLGESTALNVGVLHGVPGHRIPVAGYTKRPRFPAQEQVCTTLHAQLGECAAKVGPHSWRTSWKYQPVAPARLLSVE